MSTLPTVALQLLEAQLDAWHRSGESPNLPADEMQQIIADCVSLIGTPKTSPTIAVALAEVEEREKAKGQRLIAAPATVARTLELIASPNSDVRGGAVSILRRFGPPETFDAVAPLVEDPRVGLSAACALPHLDAERAMPIILPLLSSGSTVWRWWLCQEVGYCHITDARIVTALIKRLLRDRSSLVRASAAVRLGEIGDVRALNPLIKAARRDGGVPFDDPTVRGAAIEAIAEIKQRQRPRDA